MPELLGSAVYWLETSKVDPRPTLRGHHEADVAIVGGGYTGLWAAYHLLQSDPSLRVVVLEGESIGFGASGRNGGFAATLLDMSLALLRRNHGDDAARAAHNAVAESVGEIGATIEGEGIECEWRHEGLMVAATNPAQLDRVHLEMRTAEDLGLDGFSWLDRDQAQAVVHSPTYLGALREEHCGVLHPAKLAHGLARVIESRGATVFDYSAVTGIADLGHKLRVATGEGAVVADQVVLATNAWAAHQPWVGRKVVPLYTYIALTEPLTDEQWDSVGWENHCGVEDKRNFVHYYRRTLDGRILWGGSDGVVYPGGRIAARQDTNARVFAELRSTFRRTFPQLDQVRFTHHWGGPVGVTSNFVPTFSTLLGGRLHTGVGYNGHGVAPSHTGGKILRDKVLGRATAETDLCFVDREVTAFPPEPLRWVGAELSRRSLLRQDAQHDAGKGSGEMEPLMMKVLNRLG